MTTLTTYPQRLPKSIKAAAERLSKADGTCLNQFVATAVAEKIAVMEASAFFEVRAERAWAAAARGEPSALLTMLNRTDGEPPRDGDELPKGQVPVRDSAVSAARTEPKAGKRRVPVRKAAAKKRT